MYAHASFRLYESNDGVTKVRMPIRANGAAIHSRYGRYFPQREFVLSAMIPIIGSETASYTFVISSSSPASASVSPNTLE